MKSYDAIKRELEERGDQTPANPTNVDMEHIADILESHERSFLHAEHVTLTALVIAVAGVVLGILGICK